jgi:8-oxo-dGTP pyrophosphatase MutT (NUDIX family)
MSDHLIRTDPRFWVLSEALASYASDRDDPPIQEGDRLQAAVSVVIRGRKSLDFLLIKRATSERDPWSGHMALPGGRRDESDTDLLATSRRETLEETGVDLEAIGAPLGRLDDVAPSSVRLPKLTISSYVFGVPADTVAVVASPEVESVHWVPLDALRDPANHGQVDIPLPGGPRDFPCYQLVGEQVWGLTHRILQSFLTLYPESELDKLRSP